MTEDGRRNDFRSSEVWRAVLAEFIAVFLLVFVSLGAVTSALAVSDNTLNAAAVVLIALTFGLTIAVLVAATASISGGHVNPAVTLGFVLTRRISLTRGMMYWIAQIIGAIAASYVLAGIVPDAIQGSLGANELALGVSVGSGFLIELILTFALVLVVFATAVDPNGPRQLAPLAIGLTVVIAHLMSIPLTGTSVNPARSLGPALVANQWAHHWIYWVGPLVGGGLAALVYEYVLLRKAEATREPADRERVVGAD